MDPVFNDTETYNIPHNQTFSPYSDSRALIEPNAAGEQDAVQNFLRETQEQNDRFQNVAFPDASGQTPQNDPIVESTLFSALANTSAYPQSSESLPNGASQAFSSQTQSAAQSGDEAKAPEVNIIDAGDEQSALQTGAENASEPESNVKPDDVRPNEGGVDYQSLLDTISQSASTAPAADPVSAPTTAASSISQGAHSLPPIPGLPPKPPASANIPEEPSYHAFSDSRNGLPEQVQQANNDTATANGAEPSVPGSNQPMLQELPTQLPPGWPPQITTQFEPVNPEPSFPGQPTLLEPQTPLDPNERPWTPKTQSLYDQFLNDERRYVTEGIWDKFPTGSRLFVGNLPSEKVTKRDLFHIFHKHGRLAQVSIKQAYGFIQYLEASSCHAALQAEQGVEIRGRKMHLEVSKPQKNTRNQNQNNKRRRSRSPDRGNSRQNDHYSGRSNFNDFRDGGRGRRDDHRSGRSPSPKSRRSRDDYRPGGVQSPRFGPDGRQRSPHNNTNMFPPPLAVPAAAAVYDEEAALPLPRRDLREVPDVQLLVLEPSVAQSFINWIEQGFRAKGLRASTIWLSARLPLNAVVKRQIIEGVQAVVKLSQHAQYNSKIPLQVFDRSSGASNVNFNEYVDLDVSVAADVVLQARQKEQSSSVLSPTSYPPPGFPQQAQPQHHQQYGHPPPPFPPQFPPQMTPGFPPLPPPPLPPTNNPYQYNQQQQYHQGQVQTPITPNSAASGAPPNLQQLLANLRQPGEQQQPTPNPNERPQTDLAGLLSNVARQQQQGQSQGGQYPQSPATHAQQQQQQQYQQPQHQHQGYGGGPVYGAGQQQQQPQQNVQNIMDTLARYNR
jgi:hypothetical protein